MRRWVVYRLDVGWLSVRRWARLVSDLAAFRLGRRWCPRVGEPVAGCFSGAPSRVVSVSVLRDEVRTGDGRVCSLRHCARPVV